MASIKQRSDGVWRARYRDSAGKEHARHFKLKRDAQRWLDEVATAVVSGTYVHPRAGDVSWASWTAEWLDRQSWTSGTVDNARDALKGVPWASKPIGAVKPSHVEAWVAGELKRGLAASTMKVRLATVKQAFTAAVRDKVIAESPAATVKPPRQPRTDTAIKILTPAQCTAALEHADDFRIFVQVALVAGLRLGEIAGLQLGDIDFLRRTITIRRQVVGDSVKRSRYAPPKAGSARTVYAPDELLHTLAAHVQAEALTEPTDILIADPLGRPYNRSTAGARWRDIRTAANLPTELTIHSCRHTNASALIAAGCDVVTVSRHLGHANPTITLNTYSHLWPTAEDKTRGATAAFLTEITHPHANAKNAS